MHDHLADDLLGPLGFHDTELWVPVGSTNRLPAGYRHTDSGLVELEPAAGGCYASQPPFDVNHGELVWTVRDDTCFARARRRPVRRAACRAAEAPPADDQRSGCRPPPSPRTAPSPASDFWDAPDGASTSVSTPRGARAGRYGRSGGHGTNVFVDPDGTVGVLLTQIEMGERMQPLLDEFQALPEAA